MRAFVAIDLPPEVTGAFARLQDLLPFGRTLEEENLHLTLAFLDDQPVGLLEEVHLALEALHVPAFELQPKGIGTFGSRAPATLWAGLRDSDALAELHRRVRGAARLAGLDLPRERFRPHVTLARFRRPPGADDLERLRRFLQAHADFDAPAFVVRSFALYRSTLTQGGAIHEEIARYPLR